MSYELTEKLLKVFADTGDMKMSYRELATISAKEIERLWERCAKVMCFRCAEGSKPFYNGTIWMHMLEKKTGRPRESWNEDCEASAIRQLDFTKLDEGGEEKV